jgi:hypothetical protein
LWTRRGISPGPRGHLIAAARRCRRVEGDGWPRPLLELLLGV